MNPYYSHFQNKIMFYNGYVHYLNPITKTHAWVPKNSADISLQKYLLFRKTTYSPTNINWC